MDGVLVVDKPEGPTSHDVVATARRTLGQQRVGHTGTLDPLATGVLPLALGRATRLVRFLTASSKDYEATILFGRTTDTYDVTGTDTGHSGIVPSRASVLQALQSLRGDYLQQPPAFSAKKVGGRRAYDLARRQEAVQVAAAPVRVSRLEMLDLAGSILRVELTCSAGFYVRAFAMTLGELTGAGACLQALRRTRSGEFTLSDAVALDELGSSERVASRLIGMEALLRDFPAVSLTLRGREHVAHGRELEPGDYTLVAEAIGHGDATPDDGGAPSWVRLLDSEGALVAVATGGKRPGSLHPSLVLI